jgi:hypothetical protein
MSLNLTTCFAVHWAKGISARTTGTCGAPLILTIHGGEIEGQHNSAEITIYTDNPALTESLIAAINGVRREVSAAEQAILEEV